MYFIYDGKEAKLSIKEEPGYEVGKVNWRNLNIQVSLVSKHPVNNIKNNNVNSGFYNVLKSNLQKQVRRKDIHAVATCETMLELNPFDTLRRLVIIAAEDVEISKQTSAITWLMAAVSKNYQLTRKDINFILVYVNNLVNHNTTLYSHTSEQKLTDINEILDSKNPDKEYIAGIFFRTTYGGMSGDMTMINQVCSLSITRDSLHSFKFGLLIKTELEICDAAVDFHVYPGLCDEISQDTNISSELVKELIWNCSSKINKRCPSEPLNPVWEIIRKSFELRSKTYLHKVINNL